MGINLNNIYILKSGKKYDLGLLRVKLEELYHDVPNFGLKWEYNGLKGIYITDTARVDHIKAKNYDLYLIESNYNEELLEEHRQNCEVEGELYYLDRVPRTHLSDKKCNDFLIENMGQDSNYEKIHKSSYNYVDID